MGVKVPHSLVPKPSPDPTGAANINILCDLIERTRHLPGSIADCGVYLGASTAGIGLYLRQRGIEKTIFGFDSFEGFDSGAAARDLELGGAENEDRHLHGFDRTSIHLVERKLRSLGLKNVILVKGFFAQSLPDFAARYEPPALQFSFVHLDVNLYESYKVCLEFFYPRLAQGGILLFDEYNDPPWPGCNKAVDEFLRDKPETLSLIEREYYQKWYVMKS